MPDIAKINAVAIADIEKVDGILAANIANINGLTVPSAVPVGTPAAAYSVRLLDTALGVPTYTGAAMRVRRETAGGTGDDDEADIAFDSGIISLDSAISNASAGVTATTLGQFINVGTVNGTTYTNPDSLTVTASCLVDTWMDQSSNGNDAEQATHSSQPQIHDGTADTDLIKKNGKPSLSFDGSGDNLEYTGNFLGGSAATGVSVSSFDNATRTAREIMWGGQDLSGARYNFLITRQASNAGSVTTQNGIDFYVEGGFTLNNPNVGTITDTDQHLYTAIYSNNVRRIVYNNGTTLTTDAGVGRGNLTDTTAFVIGADISGGSNSIDGQIQEVVIWNADQEADGNRTDIEDNINAEFGIY